MPDSEIIAYHGWGFDATCWQPWEQLIPEQITWKNFDRGYFCDPNEPKFSDDCQTKIIFVHSFGLHLCDDEVLNEVDILAVFGGFLRFHPKAAQFKRRSRKILNEMIKQFEENPNDILKAFYRNVFHPRKTYELPPDDKNESRLLEDLKRLDTAERKVPNLKENARIFIFHGTEDAIIPKQKGRSLFEKFGDRARYFEIKKSGHALPITNSHKCWQLLEPEVLKLIN